MPDDQDDIHRMLDEQSKPPYRQSVGSLCSGYGGLDLGLALGLGHNLRHAWHVEYDKHPSKVLAARWPGVPNYGDITTLDHAALEPVDWLTAGYPCQPFSHAGKRKGTKDARHLWPFVASAIGALRPRGVLLENVAGHVSLGLDTVLWDLAALGYDASWGVVRAADAGAPHNRARIFILAAGARGERHGSREDAGGVGCLDRSHEGGTQERERAWPEPGDRGSAVASDAASAGRERGEGSGWQGGRAEPAGCAGATANPAFSREPHQPGGTDGTDALVGTFTGTGDRARAGSPASGVRDMGRSAGLAWGPYAPAIARWERVLGRSAPPPFAGTQVNARFVEWMQGLPDGWVTDILPHRPATKALGNGVVPQQAALAVSVLRHNWPIVEVAA